MEKEVQEQVGLAKRLQDLGLKRAAKKVDSASKMTRAYEKYLFVTKEKIDAFNEKLRKDTLRETPRAYEYRHLIFVKLADYPEIPPPHVLEALETAKADECFDEFEVAKIELVKEEKDPIVFGLINGCTDMFFISQWDDDVKIEDIMFMDSK